MTKLSKVHGPRKTHRPCILFLRNSKAQALSLSLSLSIFTPCEKLSVAGAFNPPNSKVVYQFFHPKNEKSPPDSATSELDANFSHESPYVESTTFTAHAKSERGNGANNAITSLFSSPFQVSGQGCICELGRAFSELGVGLIRCVALRTNTCVRFKLDMTIGNRCFFHATLA